LSSGERTPNTRLFSVTHGWSLLIIRRQKTGNSGNKILIEHFTHLPVWDIYTDREEPLLQQCKGKKESYPWNRPCRPIELRDVEAFTYSRLSAHRWRWCCKSYAPADRPLPPGRFLVFISVRGWIDPSFISRLKGLGP
jgi:hypothetical protein